MFPRSAAPIAFLALVPAGAGAVGLDRSNQPIDLLFESGNHFELSFGRVFPELDGTDLVPSPPAGELRDTGDVGDAFSQLGAGAKFQVSDRLSLAVITDEPYGASLNYPSFVDGGSFLLGGTKAEVDSKAVSALARYEITDSVSVHGGLRYQRISASVTLDGAASGPLAGYEAEFDEDWDLGYVIGAAYERPDIALRVAVTYFSGTDHELSTRETLGGVPANLINPLLSSTSTTSIDAPEAVNLDFQTGIAPGTLLFGQIRWANYDEVMVAPIFFDTAQDGLRDEDSLTETETGFSYNLGIGRQITDTFAASISVGYDGGGEDDLVSPLAPTNGSKSIGLGLSYDVTERLNLAGGVRYVRLSDARPEVGTPDTAVADFEDNHAVGFGVQIGYKF